MGDCEPPMKSKPNKFRFEKAGPPRGRLASCGPGYGSRNPSVLLWTLLLQCHLTWSCHQHHMPRDSGGSFLSVPQRIGLQESVPSVDHNEAETQLQPLLARVQKPPEANSLRILKPPYNLTHQKQTKRNFEGWLC